jgi:hypothetical protein
MKHILNNLSNEEKNSIREQHTGGMNVMTENFSKLLNSKLGDSKPLVSEQTLTAGNAVSQKPTTMSSKVKMLIGYLKNNGYTSSEIYQAQQYIKNLKAAPTPAQQKPGTPAVSTQSSTVPNSKV